MLVNGRSRIETQEVWAQSYWASPMALKYFLKIDCFFCFINVSVMQSNGVCEILGFDVLDLDVYLTDEVSKAS